MFKVSSILTDTAMRALLSMADCSVNDTMVKVVPFLKQSFFHMIHVADSLLQNAPIAARDQWKQLTSFSLEIHSAIIFVPLFFSTVRPLVKILSHFDNILLICLSAHGRHAARVTRNFTTLRKMRIL